jgi:O-acetyl-ADP-ribose deacetylase (regulator of RNase III)
MAVEFKTGDLFATPELRTFAQGCNCAGAMGKGIAVFFKQRWPKMYEEYRRRCKNGTFRLGDVFTWVETGYTIFNLGTQESWKTKAELWAIESSINGMLRLAEEQSIRTIALPKIGAGLGGLPWEQVKERILNTAGSSAIELCVCEKYIRGQPLN